VNEYQLLNNIVINSYFLIYCYLEFHALDYKTYESKDFTVETSGDTDTVTKTIEGAEITAETSGATYIKTYGAMTYEEFKAFKFSEHINLNTIPRYSYLKNNHHSMAYSRKAY